MTVNYQSQLVTYAVSYTPRDVPVEEVVVDEETPVIDEPTLDVLEERVANFWEWKTYSENIII